MVVGDYEHSNVSCCEIRPQVGRCCSWGDLIPILVTYPPDGRGKPAWDSKTLRTDLSHSVNDQ